MKKLLQSLLIASITFGTSVNAIAGDSNTNNERTKAALQAHIEFLADDYLAGRDTGSNEYEIAARYVVSHFKQYGLKPAGDNGSWYQSVPFTESTLDMDSVYMAMHKDGKKTEFKYRDEFLSGANAASTKDYVKAPLVFVGYGIVSKELGHNDYEGLDVKGKIVVMLSGKPDSFPSEQGAHVASGTEKTTHAATRGAVGVITLHTEKANKVRTYESILPFTGRPRMTWNKKEGGVHGSFESIKAGAYVPIETGKKLFAAGGKDLQKVFDMMAKDEVPKGFDLDVEVELRRESSHRQIFSSNVVGMIEGSDPELKNEYVVYSGHLDHIGVHGDGEDKIHNGALDNASGIAIMIETARMYMEQKQKPKRSILFVAVTGEEKGLLGSNYFAHYPTVSGPMVANINLDMPLILYPFADVIAFGAQHSSMQQNVEQAAQTYGIKLSPDPMPEQALFVRSDHYSWVKKGVPSIFLVPGMQSQDPQFDGSKIFGMFLQKHYHKVSDDVNLPINYDAGVTFSKVNFAIGLNIANADERPTWNEGNFFGETFGVGKTVN